MRTIFALFDTSIRNAFGCYGGTVHTPNFDRLAERGITFDTHYTGSLPCMPARRDLQTGRLNFLHASWGCLEPFDHSLPRLLREEKGIHSHLITDHPHYFANGGFGYHSTFDRWEFMRGQEGDPDKSVIGFPYKDYAHKYNPKYYPVGDDTSEIPLIDIRRQHLLHRERYLQNEEDFPLTKCYDAAIDFLNDNHDEENWFLQVECFDPHEPYYASERFNEMYETAQGLITNWPRYARLFETPEEADLICRNYAALLTMCDFHFGRLLDTMDHHDMWKDTALILSTDHGLLLGEHDWWGKNRQPYYEEISHIPMIIHHPDYAGFSGERRKAVTQTPDIMPTILDFHGVKAPPEVTAHSLLPLLPEDSETGRHVLFGMFGGAIGITNGDYAYYLYPDDLKSDNNLYEYTLMPEHLRNPFSIDELKDMTLADPFNFTRGVQVLKVRAREDSKRIPLDQGGAVDGFLDAETVLFNLRNDPEQKKPLRDPAIEEKMKAQIIRLMEELDAPPESYKRFNLKQ